ncbi:MAG: UDP-N-acetylglucosamine--N-acetylmuramyl-(pentapeptide) pyrophosphoryl-undecaprenol N-acetylglucosamine transferase [Phycisphaerales bacterium]
MRSPEPIPPGDGPVLVLAGGGTGGHLFPMIGVCEHLAGHHLPDVRVVAMCSERAVDRRVLEPVRIGGRPITIVPTPAAPLRMSPGGLLRLAKGWGPTVRVARGVFRAAHPARCAVLTTSGFVAPAIVRAARTDRVPVLALNLDDPPGKATRWIERSASARLDATLSRSGGDRWESVPPIVRARAIGPGAALVEPEAFARAQREARERLGLAPDLPMLMVLGGSQGATTIDRFMGGLAGDPSRGAALRGWQVLHQAHPDTLEGVDSAYERAGIPARVVSFLDDMGLAWTGADLVVARAGAGCVAEAWANRVPTVFFPYPHHRDQHQRRNAQPLADLGLGIIAEDLIEPDQNLSRHGALIEALLADTGRRAAMRASIAPETIALGVARSARILSEWLSGGVDATK